MEPRNYCLFPILNANINICLSPGTDLDECSNILLNNCSYGSEDCVNTVGSFLCKCRAGYARNTAGACAGRSRFSIIRLNKFSKCCILFYSLFLLLSLLAWYLICSIKFVKINKFNSLTLLKHGHFVLIKTYA